MKLSEACSSTCGGTQSPWPGSPVSSFQSPTLMAAWTEVSHTGCSDSSPNWRVGWDLVSGIPGWDLFWYGKNVCLDFDFECSLSVLDFGRLDCDKFWFWDVVLLNFVFKRVWIGGGDLGRDVPDPDEVPPIFGCGL